MFFTKENTIFLIFKAAQTLQCKTVITTYILYHIMHYVCIYSMYHISSTTSRALNTSRGSDVIVLIELSRV